MEEPLTDRLNLPMTRSLIEAIDEWRRQQADIPARATAARRLIELGLGKVAKSQDAS
jgi:hypothetical protein